MEWFILLPVLLLILAAEFVNGWNDACNSIATVVSTRVLSPMTAVIMAVGLNIVGAMSGTAVAATLGKDVVARPRPPAQFFSGALTCGRGKATEGVCQSHGIF